VFAGFLLFQSQGCPNPRSFLLLKNQAAYFVTFCKQAGFGEQIFKYLAFLFAPLCRYYEKAGKFF